MYPGSSMTRRRTSTGSSVDERPRSRRLRDVNIRLARAHQQAHAVLADDLARQRLQVLVAELAVQLRARVDDAPVDRRTHRDACRPVLGGQRQLQRAQMHVVHRDQAPLLERAAPPLAVLEAHAPQQHAAPQIELLAIRQELDAARIEPVLPGDAKLRARASWGN